VNKENRNKGGRTLDIDLTKYDEQV